MDEDIVGFVDRPLRKSPIFTTSPQLPLREVINCSQKDWRKLVNRQLRMTELPRFILALINIKHIIVKKCMITHVSRTLVYTSIKDGVRVIGELKPVETNLDLKYIMSRPMCPVITDQVTDLGLFEDYSESCSDLRWLLDSNRREQLRNEIYDKIHSGVEAATVVQQLLSLYGLYREKFDHVLNVFREVYEELLCLAAHLCQKYKMDDPVYMEYIMVEHLLQTHYPADWFDLLSPLATLTRANSLYPYKFGGSMFQSWITDQHIQAMEYYILHGNAIPIEITCEATFNTSGGKSAHMDTEKVTLPVRFVNVPVNMRGFGNVTPLTWACLQGTPKVVRLLLRYGADPLHPFSSCKSPHCNWDQPLFALSNTINSRVQRFWTAKNSTSQQSEWELSDLHRTEEFMECLQWLLASQPYLPLHFKCEFRNLTNDRRHKEKSFLSYICVDKRVKPYLSDQLTQNVSRLQTICRYNIRKVLICGKLPLPKAINGLPLPTVLKEYLDLCNW